MPYGIIYTRVFAPLRNEVFHHIKDLNKAILELLREHNGKSFRGREYSRSAFFEEVEKQALLPLPNRKYELKSYASGTVHKNSHIYLSKDKHYYSVPFEHIGKRIKIIYSESTVCIYYKHSCIATHERMIAKYGYTTLPDHMPSHHRFVSEWSAEKFINWASNIGPSCKSYIVGILDKKQHPEQSYKSCLGILHLTKKVGDTRLENACKRALGFEAFNYNIITRILEKGWETIGEVDLEDTELPTHKNIRGKGYYK